MSTTKRPRPTERPPHPAHPPPKQPRTNLQHHRRRTTDGDPPSSRRAADQDGHSTSSALSEAPRRLRANRHPLPRQPLSSSLSVSPRAPPTSQVRRPNDNGPLSEKYEQHCLAFFQSWLAPLKKDGLSETHMAKITSQSFQLFLQRTLSAEPDKNGVARPFVPASLELQLTQLFQQSSPPQPPEIVPPGTVDDDDESVHIPIGRDAPAERPKNLVQALQKKIQAEQGTTTGTSDDARQRLRAAARLQGRSFPNTVSADDVHALGAVLLGDVFGGRGQKRLADALLELYGDETDRTLSRSLQSVADATTYAGREHGRGGSAKVAAFASRLSHAVLHDAPTRTVAEDIRMLDAKVQIIRVWERWSQPDHADGDVAEFLDGEGIPRDSGVVLASRITKYLATKMRLPASQLAKKIYAWRPITILEEVFSPGVLALLPKSVCTSYVRLRKHGAGDTATKETKFRAVVAALVEELPLLLDVCTACDSHIVQNVLASPARATQPLADLSVPGIKMAVEGGLRLLHRTSICDLLAVAPTPYPPVGTVEELEDGDGEDGGDSENGGDGELLTGSEGETPTW